ncbi:MAG: hypothetical protein AB2A00_02150 [Myxococcota bacterium]
MRASLLPWCVLALVVVIPLASAQTEETEPPPRTLAEVGTRYQTECPPPLFKLQKPETVSAAGHNFVVEGSTMVRQGGRWQGPLTIGVLGAIKDASPETAQNIRKAQAEFHKRGVQLVVANGDISEGEFDLEDAFKLVGREVKTPVLAFIGNSEGKGSFTRAFLKARAEHPHLFNMTWMRHVDLGGIHLVALPGYYNLKFLHGRAGCHYQESHVRELGRLVDSLNTKGDLVILTAHGPPQSFGKAAIDVAHDAGNVGDPMLTDLIERSAIPFGIFGHILEAGGRATSDLKRGTPLKLPVKKPVDKLYFNAGSASASPWAMLDGSQSYGMAAVLSIQDKKGTLEFIKLR